MMRFARLRHPAMYRGMRFYCTQPPASNQPAATEKVRWYALWNSERGRKILKWGLAAYVVVLSGIYAALWNKEECGVSIQRVSSDDPTAGDRAAAAAIGGHMQLIDHNGNEYDTEKQLADKWWMVYFGFTNCPTVCPAELTMITKTLKLVEKQLGEEVITPIFVTVDHDRDSSTKIKEFLKPFHPSFVGLTGTEEQLKKAAKTFRVYHSVIDTEDQDLAPGQLPEDYQIDHSCIIYLMNQNGKFTEFFSKITDVDVAVAKIIRHFDGTMDFMNEGRS